MVSFICYFALINEGPVSKLSGLDEVARASVAEAGSGWGFETSLSYTSKIEV